MKYIVVNGLKAYPFKVFYPGMPYAQYCMFCEDICLRLNLHDGSSDEVFNSGVGRAESQGEQTWTMLYPYVSYEFNEAVAEICNANWNDPIAAMLGKYLVLNFSESRDDNELAAKWAGAMDKMISALSKGSKRFCMSEACNPEEEIINPGSMNVAYVPPEGMTAYDYPRAENHVNIESRSVFKLCGIYDTQTKKFINITDVIEPYCQEGHLIENPDNHILMANFGSNSHPFSISYTEKGAYLYGNYQGDEKTVRLPDYYFGDKNRLLESIDEYVFYHAAAEEVIFPNGIKNINFLEAYSLKKFNIPNGCESIKLRGCTSIEELDVLPLSLKKIEISSCDALTSLIIPESVEKIKLADGCKSMKSLIINSSDLKECEIDIEDGLIENIEFCGQNVTIQRLNLDKCNCLKNVSFGMGDVKIEYISIDSESFSGADLPKVLDIQDDVKSQLLEMAKAGAKHTPGCELPDVLVKKDSIPSELVEEAKKALKECGDYLCAAMISSNFTHPLFSQDLDLTIEALGYYVNIKDTSNERVKNMEMQLSLEEIQMIMDNMGPEAVQPETAQAETAKPEAVQLELVKPEVEAISEAAENSVIVEMPVVEEPVIAEVPEMAAAEEPAIAEVPEVPEVPVAEEPAIAEVSEVPEVPEMAAAEEPVIAEVPEASEIPVVEEPAIPEMLAVEEELPVLEMPVMEEEPTIMEMAAAEEMPAVEEVAAEEEMPAVEEVAAELEAPVIEEQLPAAEEVVTVSDSSLSNLIFMNKESGKGAFCVEIDGAFLGAEAGTKHPVMITGNSIVYVNGNNLVTQNICTGEKRNDEMEEMILFTITEGMKNNIGENRTYANNSIVFKWLVSKLLGIKEEANAVSEINEYFDFIQIGITAVCEGERILFKTTEGNELFIVSLFEKISTIRA